MQYPDAKYTQFDDIISWPTYYREYVHTRGEKLFLNLPFGQVTNIIHPKCSNCKVTGIDEFYQIRLVSNICIYNIYDCM